MYNYLFQRMGSMLMAPIKMTFSCYTISFRSAKLTEDMKVQQNLIIIFSIGGPGWVSGDD